MEISDEELKSLNRAILTRYGVDFTCYETNSLKRRVSRVISVFGLNSVHTLWVKLLKDRNFIYPFIDELTVGLTSMFRDPILWKTLKKNILPSLDTKSEINILHAGCSTGEEAYSMGIVLQELGLQDKAKATALDLNQRSIKIAKAGQYSSVKMSENIRNYSEYRASGFAHLNKYYKEIEGGKSIQMNSDLIKHVTFKEHNLVSDALHQQYDIIFCRNVMIYFDNTMKLKLLDMYYKHLKSNGFLIIGFYDALVPLIDEDFFSFYNLEAKVFQKKG